MKIPESLKAELAVKQEALAQQQAEAAAHEELLRQSAARVALRERGLAMGIRLTRLFRATGHNGDGYRLSKIATLNLPPDIETPYEVQARVAYKPPIRGDGGKNLGFDETVVALRLRDAQTDARTSFRDIASFDRCGWIRYINPAEDKSYLQNIESGDPRLEEIGGLLDILDAAKFDISED